MAIFNSYVVYQGLPNDIDEECLLYLKRSTWSYSPVGKGDFSIGNGDFLVVSPSTTPIMRSLYWVVGQDAFFEQLAMTHIPQQPAILLHDVFACPVITNKLASLPEQLATSMVFARSGPKKSEVSQLQEQGQYWDVHPSRMINNHASFAIYKWDTLKRFEKGNTKIETKTNWDAHHEIASFHQHKNSSNPRSSTKPTPLTLWTSDWRPNLAAMMSCPKNRNGRQGHMSGHERICEALMPSFLGNIPVS